MFVSTQNRAAAELPIGNQQSHHFAINNDTISFNRP